MNTRRILPPLLIALLVSGLCTLALSRKLGHTVEKVPLQHYVAASHALQPGEVLKPDSLKIVSWPATNPLVGTFARPEMVVGRAVLYPVDADQPLTERLVSAVGAGTGLAGHIPDGMRAIALKSDEIMGVAGFLLPGSHLDVLVTYRTDKSPDPITATVLQDVEMIAAGHQLQPDPDGKAAPVDVVTLLLTPADAERAVLASTQGAIHFVLRSGSDKGHTHDDGVSLSQLSGLTPGPPPPPAAQLVAARHDRFAPITPPSIPGPPKPVHQQVVQTISGDKQVSATFDEVIK